MRIDENQFETSRDEVAAYFNSIAKAYEEDLRLQRERKPDYDGFSVSVVFFFGFLLSILPLIPGVAYVLAFRFIAADHVSIWGLKVSLHSFVFWYVLAIAVSGGAFGCRLAYSAVKSSKGAREIATEILTDQQKAFAHCYSVILEIDNYRVNKRDAHIQNARTVWRKLMHALESFLGFRLIWRDDSETSLDDDIIDVMTRGFHPRVTREFFSREKELTDRISWFQLMPGTVGVISALNGLRSKIGRRLTDRKDLFQISNCLFPLSVYLYTQIPDIADTESEKQRLVDIEGKAIQEFARLMNALEEYSTAEAPVPKTKAQVKRARFEMLRLSTVSSQTSFIRFISFWVLVQVFVGAGIGIAIGSIANLHLDSTMTALLIGTPFAVAAAMTALQPAAPPSTDRS